MIHLLARDKDIASLNFNYIVYSLFYEEPRSPEKRQYAVTWSPNTHHTDYIIAQVRLRE